MKKLAAFLLAANTAHAEIVLDANTIGYCTQTNFLSSCIKSSQNASSLDVQAQDLNLGLANTNNGLLAKVSYKTPIGKLRASGLEGEITNVGLQNADWSVNYNLPGSSLQLRKGNLGLNIQEEEFAGEYRINNFRIQSTYGQEEYALRVFYELRF